MRSVRQHVSHVTAGLALWLAVLCPTGCSLMAPARSPLAETERGELRLNWRARRHLRVLDHRCRLDPEGRLVVSVSLANFTDAPFRARVRVSFRGPSGEPEVKPIPVQECRFPPGRRRMEWTSYAKNVSSYVVLISGTGLLPW